MFPFVAVNTKPDYESLMISNAFIHVKHTFIRIWYFARKRLVVQLPKLEGKHQTKIQ